MKKRTKKLVLNRETLRSLEGKNLLEIQGGATRTCTCVSLCDGCTTREESICVVC